MAVVMARETYDPKGNPVRVESPEPKPETESLPHSAAPSPAPSRAPGRPPRHRLPPSAAEAAPNPEARAEPDEIPSTVATAESRVSAQQNLQSEALRFIAAYAYFLDDYGTAGLQQPFLDEASQELELNGFHTGSWDDGERDSLRAWWCRTTAASPAGYKQLNS